MISKVTGKHQVTIPAALAAKHGIKPGTRLEWSEGKTSASLSVRVLPDRATLAEQVRGTGKAHLKPGSKPLRDLDRERERDDAD